MSEIGDDIRQRVYGHLGRRVSLNALEERLAVAVELAEALEKGLERCDACHELACLVTGWGSDVEFWCHKHASQNGRHLEDNHAAIALLSRWREVTK